MSKFAQYSFYHALNIALHKRAVKRNYTQENDYFLMGTNNICASFAVRWFKFLH